MKNQKPKGSRDWINARKMQLQHDGKPFKVTFIENGKKQCIEFIELGFVEAMAYTYARHNGCEIIKMEKL